MKAVTDFRYVRFHAVLHDELGIYNEDEHGEPVYNFYVDQVYDGLLSNGIRPMVEISFMPKKLAFNPDALHPFWYKPNLSPPKSWERWDDLMVHFAQHLIEGYGIDEVSQWYFEVWNEPNIDFWGGIPRQESYFELYDHTARALKNVSQRIRVGGPATAAAAWVDDFLKHAAENHSPVDFVSSHGYADDTVRNLFGTNEDISEDDRVCRAIAKVKQQIQASSMPKLPLFWTEWNVPGKMQVRDTTYVGPVLAHTVRDCDGKVDMMSFGTFSDVFEEGGPIPKPFVGMCGLRAKGGINKPSYYAYSLLHQLGMERLPNPSKDIIITKTKSGIPGLKIALPSTPADAKGLMTTAIRDDNPVVYLHHYMLTLDTGEVPEGPYVIPFGVADIKRAGTDVTIVATAWMVKKALAAAEQLAPEGISAEVVDPRTLARLDSETIVRSVKKTGRLVLVDQAPRHSSAAVVIAAEVAEKGFDYLRAPITMVTAPDTSILYSEPLESYALLNEEKIVHAVHSVVAERAVRV